MKKYVRLLLILLSGIIVNIPLYAQEHAKKKVAVYMTGTTSDAACKKVIGAKLVNAITESGEYAAVERTADFLAALSAESDYQTSGEVRDSQIARLGQKFGVRYVVVADASEIFDEYFIAARLINVETGLVERAFDINGPADSMSQLVNLSQKVAQGLLLGSNGSYSYNGFASSNPIHMSLCAMDKNGKYVFILPEQWQKISESEKLNYTKKGICICENGEGFIVQMRDSGFGSWYSGSQYPNRTQASLIQKYIVPLNNTLRIFGGEPLRNDKNDGKGYWGYWTSEPAGYNKAIKFGCDKIEFYGETTSNDGRKREIYPIK